MVRLIAPELDEDPIEQAAEVVEVYVDVVHVEHSASWIAQGDGRLLAVGPVPVEVVLLLPPFPAVVEYQRLIAGAVRIEYDFVVYQQAVAVGVDAVPTMVAQLPGGGAGAVCVVAFMHYATVQSAAQGEQAKEV